MLGKLIDGVVTTVGGNVGSFVGPAVNGAVPQATIPVGGGKGLNLATELVGVLVGAGGSSIGSRHASNFLKGLSGGLGAAADPTLQISFPGVMAGGAATAGGAAGQGLVV
jgi:hypothetical protein